VKPGVFVPRPRSEVLVAEALALLTPGAVIADLCCGTGAVGLAIASAGEGVELHAADLDPVAVRCARRNLGGIGAVHEGDLFDALPGSLRGRIDLIVANAPYVPSAEIPTLPREAREHEPALALDGGGDGLDVHRRLLADAPEWLAVGGHHLFEVAIGQVEAASEEVERAGMTPRVARSGELEVAIVAGSKRG
jgi:release factor glutamine methyltransferase